MMRRWITENPRAGQQGFTLVELLVAMVLLSMLTLGLASVMSTVSQTQERIDSRIERMDHQRVSVGFLRSVLGQVSAVQRQAGLRKQGESDYFFAAGPQSMQWLGIMPARYGAGGRTHFQLAQKGDDLILSFTPWQGAGVEPNWAMAQHYVLARQLTSFVLRYQNGKLGAGQWLTGWSEVSELPSAIQIDLQTLTGTWPLWVVALHITPASSSAGGAVFGGTRN